VLRPQGLRTNQQGGIMNHRPTQFDEKFKQAQKMACIGMIINGVLVIGLIAFGVWSAIKIMSHFGII
jgi:hypothetical protein